MSPSYTQKDGQLTDYLDRLQHYLQTVPASLTAYSEEELSVKLPGKWSRKEVLGHLIDSAINNLKRFTDAQAREQPYVVTRYQQDHLVVVNCYQELPPAHLFELWHALNQQIFYVATAISPDKLAIPVLLPDGQSVTLTYLIEDYVAHMEHHFKTLL